MSALIFIDTNIYLDFYRVRGTDATLSILKHFDTNHHRIITTSEVEMEYKKNRQGVIIESLGTLKPQDYPKFVVPAFLRESKRNKSIIQTQKSLSNEILKLKARTAKLLISPSRNDPVYMALQRLFKAKGDCHLTRTEKVRFQIRELAQKRFLLGYPPRKASDTSIVDAINWEWIVYCAQHCSSDIIIVSRDSDYGVYHGDKSILNDWLLLEFKERVSHKRNIILTNKLTEAFKQASIRVSVEEEKSEEKLLEDIRISEDLLKSNKINSQISYLDKALQDIKNIDTESLEKMILEILSKENKSSASDSNNK